MKFGGMAVLALSILLSLTSCHNGGGSPASTPINPDNAKTMCKDTSGIVGGVCVDASDDVASRAVGLIFITDSDEVSICTASIIEEKTLLTAGHCVPSSSKYIFAIFHENLNTTLKALVDYMKDKGHTFSSYEGFFNNINYGYIPESHKSLIRTVSKIVLHEKYKSSGADSDRNDIALVRLKSSIPATHKVTELLNEDQLRPSYADVYSYLSAGYGTVKYSSKDSEEEESLGEGFLRKVAVKRIYNKEVSESDEVKSSQYTAYSPLVVIDQRDKKGVCSGDSGGALFVDIEGKRYIQGVASTVQQFKKGVNACHGYGNYMNVIYYKKWIEDSMYNILRYY